MCPASSTLGLLPADTFRPPSDNKGRTAVLIQFGDDLERLLMLVINVKKAKALGIPVSPTLLAVLMR